MNSVTKKFTVWALGLLVMAVTVRAQDVQATLSNDVVAVGQPVELHITVATGAAKVPSKLTVDGLDIQQMGQSQSSQWTLSNQGLSVSTQIVYRYLVMPLREGTFTIPAVTVGLEGNKTQKTAPLTLRVGPGGSGGGYNMPVRPALPAPQTLPPQNVPPQVQQMPPPQKAQEDYRPAFGDIAIPKKTAYVGEVVPMELRFYVDEQYPFEPLQGPKVEGDGFTVGKISDPVLRKQEMNGRLYNVVVFQTALIPAKAGELTVTKATLPVSVQVPLRLPQDMQGAFSLFGRMPTQMQQELIESDPEKIEAKALPRDGRPADFSGAVGQFSMLSTASPKKTAAGDPVSLNVVVAGEGNFEAMGEPALAESEGWRMYPPKENFEARPGDMIGYGGKKTYEFMLLAREDQSKTPEVKFSYFDPKLEKYVELTNAQIAVSAKGSMPASSQTAVASAATSPPAAQAAPEPTAPQPGDELVKNFTSAQFTPIFKQKKFLVANGVAAVAWCAALLFVVGRMASKSSYAQKSALRREAKQIYHEMEGSEAAEFYQRAEDLVALQLGGTVAGDAHAALERSSLSDERKEALRAILARNQELKYSAGFGAGSLGADERKQVLDTMKTLL